MLRAQVCSSTLSFMEKSMTWLERMQPHLLCVILIIIIISVYCLVYLNQSFLECSHPHMKGTLLVSPTNVLSLPQHTVGPVESEFDMLNLSLSPMHKGMCVVSLVLMHGVFISFGFVWSQNIGEV